MTSIYEGVGAGVRLGPPLFTDLVSILGPPAAPASLSAAPPPPPFHHHIKQASPSPGLSQALHPFPALPLPCPHCFCPSCLPSQIPASAAAVAAGAYQLVQTLPVSGSPLSVPSPALAAPTTTLTLPNPSAATIAFQQHFSQQIQQAHHHQQQQILEEEQLKHSATAVVFHQFDMRGSDVLQGGPGGNEDVLSPDHALTDNNNDAKKAKLDKSPMKPSRVVHLRNIPNEVTEAEIIHLGIPFGRVTNVLVLKGKNQAFLEMGDEVSAASMVQYFGSCMAQLRGRAVYVQFSNHKELKTDQTHSNANASAQAALQAAQALSGHTETQGGPNTVLRVVIEHMLYPVTLEVLYQIFSRYGKVLKIVTFTKNNSFQVLVQYQDVVAAQAAKVSLDGQNVYNSCCTLRIEYSKLTSLNVKYNNDKSRDYTNPSLPNGESSLEAALAAGGGGGGGADQVLPGLILNAAAAAAANPLRRSFHEQRIPGGQGVLASPFGPLHGLASPLAAPFTPGSPVAGLPLTATGFTLQSNAATAALAAQSAAIRLPGQIPTSTCVLLVSNLNEELVTTDALFTLFGVYGDVQRVKILYNKKDSALIQMAEPHQANLAMMHLDKVRLHGKQMRVMSSKHQTVQLPKEGQPDAGLTKDYTSSNLHRFKKPGSKNYQNIYPPSATLHLSNIPPNIKEEDLKEAFENSGFTVKGFKFFPKDKKMALLELPSIDDAVDALIKMHNHQLSEQNHLRVSFSKSNIQSAAMR